MKTSIIALFLLLTTTISFGQLTFVQEINYSFIEAPISSMSYEYASENLIENGDYFFGHRENTTITFDILNSDYTLFKSFTIDTVDGNGGVDGPYVSDHLFNTDDKVEYSYILYDFQDFVGTTVLKTVIGDEDGNILMELVGESFYLDDFYSINGITYVQARTNSGTTKIYRVDGDLPCPMNCIGNSSSNSLTPSPIQNALFNVFPNPTDDRLTIDSDLEAPNMQIKIYSVTGQLLQTDAFFTGNNTIDVSLLSAGTYVINIVSENGFLHTEQFVKR